MNQPHLKTERCPDCGSDVRDQSNYKPGEWDASEERSFACGYRVRWRNNERAKGEEAWIPCPKSPAERVRRDHYADVGRQIRALMQELVKAGILSRADARYMFDNGPASTPWWDRDRPRLANPFEDK